MGNPAEALSGEESAPLTEDVGERATLAVPETDELSEVPPMESDLESQDTVTAFADLSVAAIQNDAPSEETEEVPASEISPPKSKDAVIRLKRKKTTIELKVSF